MDPTCYQQLRLCSTAHFFALIGIFFSSRYGMSVFRNGKNHLMLSILFGFANVYIYRKYNVYFFLRSFEKKYRDVDDGSLENIIKSLEANRLKVH